MLQLIYVIDSEPFESVARTFADLFKQNNAVICVICNSQDSKVIKYINDNLDKIRAYFYYGNLPVNHSFLYKAARRIVSRGYAGCAVIVPGTALPVGYSDTALKMLNKHPSAAAVTFCGNKCCCEKVLDYNDESNRKIKDELIHELMTNVNISSANICVRPIINKGKFWQYLHAAPWCEIINAVGLKCVAVSESVPVFNLPKHENVFLYFLSQFRFLICQNKLHKWAAIQFVKKAMHTHGQNAADFAQSVKDENVDLYRKCLHLSRIMMRQ
jgi:hypothetical protein